MDFLADENFPMASVRRLVQAGHDVAAVAQDSPGVSDGEVLSRAVREKRALLTFDSDYGELLYGDHAAKPPQAGILYFRFTPACPEEPANHLISLMKLPGVSFAGYLTVLERERVRQRPLPGNR